MPGHIIYEGPSLIDGSPIVAIAIGSTRNPKTGDMLQTYIIRADMDPIAASRTGADSAICGACPHRGQAHDGESGQAIGRTCYVTLAHGPAQVYRAFAADRYERTQGHRAIAALGAGRMIRIGTYGDGAAVPAYIWDSLCADARGWTAYTHQSGVSGAATDPARFMTSVESADDAESAWQRGERTFRMIADASDLRQGREILCPASEEAGRRTTCASCRLCAGSSVRAKSVAIVAHGASKRRARELVA